MPEDALTDLDSIFDRLEAALRRLSPPFAVRTSTPADKRNVHLWSERELEIEGRKRKDVYFAGAIVQKRYVGFYFMPVYADEAQRELFAPELLALLRGKSCFHVTRLDETLLGRIEDALTRGYELYRERGWVG